MQLPPVTKALMLICTAIFCLQQFLAPGLTVWLALFPPVTGQFMPWQLFTYAFLHGDLLHLFFNMLGLFFFGAAVEMSRGRKRYLHLLLASLLVAAVTHLVLSALMGNVGPVIGFSGAVFGVMVAFAMEHPDREVMLIPLPITVTVKVLVIGYAVISVVFGMMGGSGIAHFAHLGGMLGGFLMTRYWRGQSPFSRRRRH